MTEQNLRRPTKRLISLRNIKTKTDVFQFRHLGTDEHHVNDLARVPDNGDPLDPLTLWENPKTGEFFVVDGHHRLAAYKQAGWRRKVPAVVHNCDLQEARLLALRENGKTRLPLSPEERLDAAWRLVCLNCYSKRVEVKETGVGEGTVAKMRRTRIALIALTPDGDLPERWWEALDALRGGERRDYTDVERSSMIEAKTAELDAKIGKELGHMASRQIEAACAVVAKRLGRQGMQFFIEEYGDLDDPFGLPEEDV